MLNASGRAWMINVRCLCVKGDTQSVDVDCARQELVVRSAKSRGRKGSERSAFGCAFTCFVFF